MLLAAVVLQTLLVASSGAHAYGRAPPHARARPHAARRSVAAVPSLPMSKGGWRPVVGNSGFSGYSLLSGAPLQAPKYKIPVPVAGDSVPNSSKNAPSRDASKLTSIAQSYKPTTLRSLPLNNLNAPVNSYLNPFSLPSTGLSHYKIVQNFPMESVVIRNPNPYQNRPFHAKFPQQMSQNNMHKFKQNQLHNAMMQQLAANNFQLYQTTIRNQYDPFSKPVEVYVRPTEAAKKPELYARPEAPKKPDYAKPGEVKKPELYRIPDSAGAQQSLNKQQVKTAQQALAVGTQKPPSSAGYQHYTFKDDKFSPIPSSILGSFGTFGFQSVKARDPAYFGTKTTYLPPAPTKHTVFNSFSFTPTLNTQEKFVTTTPKVKPSHNQIVYGNTFSNNVQVQPLKQTNTFENSSPYKGSFKASPQDPFAKPSLQPQLISNQPQVSNVYNPFKFNQFPQQFTSYYTTLPTTTADTSLFSTHAAPNRFVSQLNTPLTTFSTFYGQHTKPEYENKNKLSVRPTASIQSDVSQYSVHPAKDKPTVEPTQNTVPFRATYDVTETYEIETQPPQISWLNSADTYNSYNNQQQPPTQESEETDSAPNFQSEEHPTKLSQPELPSQYTYATEANVKPYENSLNYEREVETQSKQPSEDDFEPNQYIGKHKLKDHYYRVTTPTHSSVEATTRLLDSSTDVTTRRNIYREHNLRGTDNSGISDQLPTLPPHKHFRRPNPEVTEKEKYRKKNKNRRRRPTPNPAERDEISDHSTTILPIEVYTTEADGTVHTVRPRVRVPVYGKPKPTTPTVTTDLSTSALPTVSPTTPTVARKKHPSRRTTTSSPNDEEYETTSNRVHENDDKGSSIMKIANKQPGQRSTTYSYDYSTSETPDYSHKQDEKDTPTSDIAVNTSGDNRNVNSAETYNKGFNFHVNVKPIENKLEQYPSTEKLESAPIENKGEDDHSYEKNEENENGDELEPITTPKAEIAQLVGKLQRPRIKNNKYDTNRPRFSVKDYRNRLSSTTTTERSQESLAPKLRFPQRRLPVYSENKFQFDSDNTTEAPRKKFTPKDPRHKLSGSDTTIADTTTERHSFSTRSSTIRHRPASSSTEPSVSETITPKISSRIRTNLRNPLRGKTSTTEGPTIDQANQAPVHIKRPLRKKHKEAQNFEKDSLSEPSEDVVVTESSTHEQGSTSERYRSESAIMKIAKDEKKHQSNDHHEHSHVEHSKRVSDLTLAASKDYNTPGLFKTVSPNSRRIPNYFTIATDDPILPIEAFFPQLNQKKES